MSLPRLLALALAAFLIFSGYRGVDPAPNPGPVPPDPAPLPVPPDPQPEPVPPAPVPPTPAELVIKVDPPETLPVTLPPGASPELIAASQPLAQVLRGAPDDALVLSRAFTAWARWLSQSPTIDNTTEFRALYLKATTLLLKNHSIEGKYGGRIDQAVDASFRTFAALTTEDVPWTETQRDQARTVFQTLAYQAFQAYLASIPLTPTIPSSYGPLFPPAS